MNLEVELELELNTTHIDGPHKLRDTFIAAAAAERVTLLTLGTGCWGSIPGHPSVDPQCHLSAK